MAKYTERNRQVIRQWQLLQALQERPQHVSELAAALGTTRRTIYRDLGALQAAHFPLYNQRHADGELRWHLLGNRAPMRRAA